jgi:protein gp37
MAEQTKIEWVDHTFNPWIGCTRVSPACDNCYAAAMSHRRKWARFEPRAPRRRTGAGNWQQPLRWNRKAEKAGHRAKVFGPSLADPFDAEVSPDWRDDYLRLIEATPQLDWILLTKRPLVARKFFANRKVPDNLWPGITAENQTMLDLRVAHLLAIEAKVRVVSAEPLLGPLDLTRWQRGISWVIAGGESGPRARPSDPDWFRSLRAQCADASIPLFFKQWGEHGQDMRKVGRRIAGALLDGYAHRDAPISLPAKRRNVE